jgi:hypothetical protein
MAYRALKVIIRLRMRTNEKDMVASLQNDVGTGKFRNTKNNHPPKFGLYAGFCLLIATTSPFDL